MKKKMIKKVMKEESPKPSEVKEEVKGYKKICSECGYEKSTVMCPNCGNNEI